MNRVHWHTYLKDFCYHHNLSGLHAVGTIIISEANNVIMKFALGLWQN